MQPLRLPPASLHSGMRAGTQAAAGKQRRRRLQQQQQQQQGQA